MSAFSDFPFPEEFPVFLPNALLLDYLGRYAERFSLREHIKLGVSHGWVPGTALLPTLLLLLLTLLHFHLQSTVVSIRQQPDFATTGQWNVVTEAGGKQTSEVFDAVLVCSGSFSEPSLPLHSFPGTVKDCLWLPASRGWGEKI